MYKPSKTHDREDSSSADAVSSLLFRHPPVLFSDSGWAGSVQQAGNQATVQSMLSPASFVAALGLHSGFEFGLYAVPSLCRYEVGRPDFAGNQIISGRLHTRHGHVRCSTAARPVKPDRAVWQSCPLDLGDGRRVAGADGEAGHMPMIRLLFHVQVHGQRLPHLRCHVKTFALRVIALHSCHHAVHEAILFVQVAGQE